jgi:hypothetical protein
MALQSPHLLEGFGQKSHVVETLFCVLTAAEHLFMPRSVDGTTA